MKNKASIDKGQSIHNRTIPCALLCLLGGIILLVALLAGFPELTSAFLTLIGAAMLSTGGIHLIDSVILHPQREVASLKWKIYSNITGFIKGALFQIDILVIAITYFVVFIKIAVAVSP
jgi:hypothetical protein